MTEKLWDGRFSEKTDAIVETFTASIDVDKRLYVCDIEGSAAHCRMLAKTGIITDAEAAAIINGLDQIRDEIQQGRFSFHDRLEDIHMHIETRLVEIAGDAARKLHTARSRNDQVATDMRLYLRARSLDLGLGPGPGRDLASAGTRASRRSPPRLYPSSAGPGDHHWPPPGRVCRDAAAGRYAPPGGP